MSSRKRFAAILLVVAMILSTTSLVAATATPVLTDIAGHAAETDIKYLVGLGVLAGFPDQTFRPNALLRRSEAVKIILTATGQAGLARLLVGASPFADVPGTHWASGYIALARNAGIVHGHGDGTFTPEAFVTYAEFAKMLVEAAGLDPAPGLTWPANYVKAAQDAGIVTTAEVPFFAAGMSAPRGDAARMTTNAVAEVRNPATGLTLAQSVFAQPRTAVVAVTPAAISLGAGRTATLTAALVDAAGVTVTGVPVTWTSNNPAVATVVGGVVAAVSPGTAVITATAEGRTATVPVTVFGAASAIVLAPPAAMVANAVSTTTLTATVVDAGGRRVEDFTGTLSFVSHTPGVAAVAPASVAAVAGVATATLTAGTTVGTSLISASAAGLTGAHATATTTARVLTSISLVPAVTTLAADMGTSTSTITVRLADQAGVAILAADAPAGLVVRLTSGTPTLGDFAGGLAADNVDFPGESGLTLRSRNLVGSVAITGVVTAPAALVAVPVASTSVTMALVGPPVAVTLDAVPASTAGAALTIRARLRDVNGLQTTGVLVVPAIPVTLTRTHVATGAVSTFTADVAAGGVATFAIAVGDNTLAGEFTYRATAGTLTASAVVTGVTSPGAAAALDLLASPSSLLANGVHQSTLTARVVDAHGNLVTAGTFPVRFEPPAAFTALRAFTATTVNTVGGIATFVVTAGTVHGPSDIVTASTAGLASDTVSVTTTLFGTPNRLFATIVDAAPTVGGTQRVTVEVRDSGNIRVTTDNSTVVTLTATRGGVLQATLTATAVNGIASFSWTQTATGAVTYRATAPGLTEHSVTGAVAWTPGALAALHLTADLTTLGAGGHVAALTIAGRDAHGNAAPIPAATAAALTLTAPVAHGVVAHVAPALAGTFTSNPTVGTTVITASAPGVTSASVTITTIIVGVPAALRIEPITSVAAGATQTVAVTVLDAAGNRVTDNTMSITLTEPSPTAAVATSTVAAVKGRASFTVTNVRAEPVTYTATATGIVGVATATGTGTFTPGAIAKLLIDAPTPGRISGDGSAIATYRVRVTDANDNTVTTASGTVTFEIMVGRDFADVLTPTLTIVGGEALATVRSRAVPVATQHAITVRASTANILLPDGVALAPLDEDAVLVVDRVLPTVTVLLNSQLTAAGGLNPSDTVVFSEDLSAASRTAVQTAILAARTTGTLSFAWAVDAAGVTTLTVTNTHAADATNFGVAPVTVSITDLAGNTTTAAPIVDLP